MSRIVRSTRSSLAIVPMLALCAWTDLARAQTAPPPAPAPAPAPEATPAPAPEAPPPPPPPPPTMGKDAVYSFGKAAEVKAVEWKASASAGFSATTGNARVVTFTGGGAVSRNDGANKIALTLEGVYGETTNQSFVDSNGNMVADVDQPLEVKELTKQTAAFFKGAARYDRFFTTNNTGYLSFIGGLDIPASKQYFLGGQVGYARQILKTKMHELSAELGYDFTYDRLIAPDPVPIGFSDSVFLHSGRVFLGYLLSIGDHSGVRVSVEALINLTDVTIGDRAVSAAEATRVNGKFEFTTKIWKPLSFRAAFAARYNNAPAVNANIPSPIGHPDHYNQKLDTLTELGLVVSFL